MGRGPRAGLWQQSGPRFVPGGGPGVVLLTVTAQQQIPSAHRQVGLERRADATVNRPRVTYTLAPLPISLPKNGILVSLRFLWLPLG